MHDRLVADALERLDGISSFQPLPDRELLECILRDLVREVVAAEAVLAARSLLDQHAQRDRGENEYPDEIAGARGLGGAIQSDSDAGLGGEA